jgi:PTS system nitrogen regulatory IIA component
MQLTVRDVTRLLNVSEATVHRWIKQRGLPAQFVAGQYRFHRAELLEWATARQVKVAAELFDKPDEDADPVPGLVDALKAGGVYYGLADSNKERSLRAVINAMPLPEGVDRQLLLQLFLAREALATTAVGDGIAIPHVRSPIVLHVPRPLIALCFLEKPVDFGALDGKPVYVLFSLISPTVHLHLQLLARLSFALHDARFKQAVVRQAPAEEILREAGRVEAGLAAAGGKAAT